jgi:hypothetical protein
MRTAVPRTAAIAADPVHLRRAASALLLLAALALLLPRLAGAQALLAAPVDLVTSGSTARVLVETTDDRAVTVEWGVAPYASHVLRSPVGKHHAVELDGLEPGGVYVYRVLVGGVLSGPPRPFVMPGAAPRLPGEKHALRM